MKFNKLLVLLFFGFFMSFSIAENIKWVDRIAVVVNRDVITEKDISDLVNNMKQQITDKSMKNNTVELNKTATEQLIQKKLIAQLANRQGITVSTEEVSEQIARIAEANKISVEQLYHQLKKEGVDQDTLKKTVEENILTSKATQILLESQVQVSQEDVKSVLKENSHPETEENIAQAHQFLVNQQLESLYNGMIEQLKSSSYIKYREQPY